MALLGECAPMNQQLVARLAFAFHFQLIIAFET